MKKLIMALVMFAAPTAFADFMIEPYLGYGMGTYKFTADGDYSGLAFGARLGYETLGFTFGADVQKTSGKVESDDGTFKADTDGMDMGVFVGYQFPVLIQAYATYFLKSETELDDPSFTKKFEGSGMRIGAGYTGFPFIVINLEYFATTYDKYDGNSLTTDLKITGYALVLSVPLP